jgi:hypothetical protein
MPAFALINLLIVAGLFGGMIAMQAVGRRLAEREPEHKDTGRNAAEAAVIALLGLLLAFTFSGAGARFDARRHLVVDEANAIGTAWLRIDLLPAGRQPQARDLFRKYVDARIETFRAVPNMAAVAAASARAESLQHQIWSTSVAGATEGGLPAAFTLLLPSLNEMINISMTRTAATRIHTPAAVFATLSVLALVAAMFVGYGMALRKTRSWVQRFGFALVITMAIFVIIDFEYPRLGLIQVDSMDQLLVDVRRSMN